MLDRHRANIELFLVSFLMLFIEVVLIRWISTEIRIFAYVNNLVLLACFLGIGLGCYVSQKKIVRSLTPLLLSAILFLVSCPILLSIGGRKVHLFRDAPILLSAFTDSVIWGEIDMGSALATALGLVSTFIIFFLLLVTFIPLGQILGRNLERHKNAIAAYSVNVMASILGVWFFSFLSFRYCPPSLWFGLIAVLLLALFLLDSRKISADMSSILLLAILVFLTLYMPQTRDQAATVWSPYQKLEVEEFHHPVIGAQTGYSIKVNNLGYMALLDLSDAFIDRHPKYLKKDKRDLSQYDIPYMFRKDAEDVLILGAGGGNDAAGALRHPVKSVDAVEIDPGIYELGRTFHPERPYQDPRLNMFVTDARSFLKRSRAEYDVISFGLLDSHTLSSAYNNVRLDHYVYTKECFEEAKGLLRDDGVFTLIFEAQRPWITRRLHGLLCSVFGFEPLAFELRTGGRYGYGGMMFVTAKDPETLTRLLQSNPGLHKLAANSGFKDAEGTEGETKSIKLTTDDWPYLYLEKPMIPRLHLSIMLILMLIFSAGKKVLLPRGQGVNLHFFFLGAAFLLLEFQNISKSALIFGSTWLVNTFTISAILILILCANLFVKLRGVRNVKVIYYCLFAAVLVIYVIPLDILNVLGYVPRSIIASTILNLPIFFAGIIFIDSFSNTKRKDLAYGSNILGATMGGMLESLSFILGINALLLFVLGLYLLAFVFRMRSSSADTSAGG